MAERDPTITLLQVLDSFKATLDRSAGSIARAVKALETGELSRDEIVAGLRSVQNDLTDLSHSFALLTADDELMN
jgi:hypothetical protein